MIAMATTNPGLEDVAEWEVASWGAKPISREEGRTFFEWDGSLDELVWKIERSNTLHKVVVIFYRGSLEGIDLSWVPKYVSPGVKFAVRAQRIGEGIHSMELAKLVGEKVIEEVEKFYGEKPEVDLDYPSVVVYAESRFGEIIIGLQVSGEESLHRRYYRIYEHMASLKPTIAYSMLKLAGAEEAEVLVDPMCGSGTIAIEATKFLIPKIYCFDIKKKYVEIAKANAKAAMVEDLIEFDAWDATKLHERVTDVDLIAVNPPYGIRMGSPRKVLKLYEDFSRSSYQALGRNGKLVMITPLKEAKEIFIRNGFELMSKRSVYHGDLWTELMLFRKRTS
ncbi:rRNA (guanine-N2)-methyltransferase [Ignicoccus islandicus DSM 13165]|uniref:rRNA (Guanine-N2)-methyltransferase n=1 Tax=Ignicoccus islandicus DSM 13165 TaxID=940295 RepID=A0A0U3FQZ4_9CREN|nr:methyltransferase [Ignicoccus islandicus]ALU11888.1 rRNA (guanine-N2)-methyltransferase [Ignicoccus islandicus DSM 13165]